ncbi:hypothetical protein N7481_011526 [Penicillium waksmanii]|uniref:uncharacterized protein n=1 Tax=Penicillium waksmanii TaxID=69791 RepID=UPI0025487297|nr:uncharacterized protein N7481_011526 [Penicillium waksmanii]KAJ5974316.1 hypothetical protein N7481_011526 [Penicillium waksmanii]
MSHYGGPPNQQYGGDHYGQQGQGYPPQQGYGGPPPQGYYPPEVREMRIIMLNYAPFNPESLHIILTFYNSISNKDTVSNSKAMDSPLSIISRAILPNTTNNLNTANILLNKNMVAPPQDRGHSPYPPQQHQQQYPPQGASASYYGNAPPQGQYGNAPGPGGPEGEKGLGSTLVGGAAGGFAGHKLGGGFLGSAAGAAIGAVGMNMATHE